MTMRCRKKDQGPWGGAKTGSPVGTALGVWGEGAELQDQIWAVCAYGEEGCLAH